MPSGVGHRARPTIALPVAGEQILSHGYFPAIEMGVITVKSIIRGWNTAFSLVASQSNKMGIAMLDAPGMRSFGEMNRLLVVMTWGLGIAFAAFPDQILQPFAPRHPMSNRSVSLMRKVGMFIIMAALLWMFFW